MKVIDFDIPGGSLYGKGFEGMFHNGTHFVIFTLTRKDEDVTRMTAWADGREIGSVSDDSSAGLIKSYFAYHDDKLVCGLWSWANRKHCHAAVIDGDRVIPMLMDINETGNLGGWHGTCPPGQFCKNKTDLATTSSFFGNFKSNYELICGEKIQDNRLYFPRQGKSFTFPDVDLLVWPQFSLDGLTLGVLGLTHRHKDLLKMYVIDMQ